ncbi:MAG: NUDIX hydrolase [Bacillota bacterium]|nr:NUDIX hydrolase [Bacillota bacterium]
MPQSHPGAGKSPREYPLRPIPSCTALVLRPGRTYPEVLPVHRAAEPRRGLWCLPGGAVEIGETVEDALVREVKGETGLVVRPLRLIGMMDLITRDQGRVRFHFVLLQYLADWVSGCPRASTDAAEARWVGLGPDSKVEMEVGWLDP